MKKEIFIPYLLFVTVVIGCFYILSKDETGFYMVSLGLLLFAVFYLFEIASLLLKKPKEKEAILNMIELSALAGISLLMLCKVYLLLFLGIHKLYLFFTFVILVVAVIRAYQIFTFVKKETNTQSFVKLGLYVSLILCLVADMYSKIAGDQLTVLNILIVFGMIASFLFIGVRTVGTLIRDRSADRYFDLGLNRSFWLLFGYFLIITYSLMLKYGYADEVNFKRKPKDYVDLFYQAESGKEKPVNGKYQFQLYGEGRDEFIKRYWSNR